MIFPHELTVYPSQLVTDPDGNHVRHPAAGMPTAGYVQPGTATEERTAGTAETRHVAYLDPAAPYLDHASALVWDRRRFETIGAALRYAGPDNSLAYWRVALREVTLPDGLRTP